MVIWIIIQGFGVLFMFLATVQLSTCDITECRRLLGHSYSDINAIRAVLWVCLVIYFFWWVLSMWACTLASRLRRFLYSPQAVVQMQTVTTTVPPGTYVQPGNGQVFVQQVQPPTAYYPTAPGPTTVYYTTQQQGTFETDNISFVLVSIAIRR
jgi:hypothetical protein